MTYFLQCVICSLSIVIYDGAVYMQIKIGIM